MTYLSIDYGRKNLGLAISQGIYVSPLTTIGTKELPRLTKICKDEEIDRIIIGLADPKLKQEIDIFVQKIKSNLDIFVDYVDETLSSQKARSILHQSNFSSKNKKLREHELAAVEILENYLENTK